MWPLRLGIWDLSSAVPLNVMELQAEYELLQFKKANKASHPTLLFSASFLLQ